MADDEIRRLEKENKYLKEKIKLNEKFYISSKKGNKGLKNDLKDLKNLAKATNDAYDDQVNNLKSMSKTVGKLNLKGALSVGEAAKLNNEMTSLLNELAKIKKAHPKHEEAWKRQRDRVAQITEKIEELKGTIDDAGRSTKSLAKEGPSFLRKWASEAEGVSSEIDGYSIMFDKAGTSLGKLPGLMSSFGKAVKGVGAGVGKLAGALGGIPGLILMGVKAVWDLGMAADQFVKDANKAFAYLRGPDIMTPDVKKQFDDFNNLIFKAGENIRVGLDVSQIRELLEAVMQAGYNIQNLDKGLLNYRDAIYIASKASKTLGMVLPQVGNMVGTLMTDFRLNLEQVDKTFVQVAFDAKKSGLSTDRFWNTVQNASASLALYGAALGSASKTVKRFTEDMIGGADDAAAATENMYDIFKSGALETNGALLDLAKEGGADVNGFFRNLSEEFKGKAINIKARIETLEKKKKKTSEDVEQLKKLRTEMYNAQSKSNRYQKMIGKSGVIQATEAAALAKETPELLMSVIKRVAEVGDLSKISGEKTWVAIKSMKQWGVHEKTIRMLIEEARFTGNKIKDLVENSLTFFSANNKAFQENKKTISEAVKKVGQTQGDEQIEAIDSLATLLTKELNMDENMAKTWGNIIRADESNADYIAKKIAAGDTESLKELRELISTSKMTQTLTISRFKDQEKTQDETTEAAEKTFKGIVDQTLSFKEMTEIAKSEIQYRTSHLGLLQAMNTGVFGILKILASDHPGFMTESQKAAQEMIKNSLIGNERFKNIKVAYDKGNITLDSQYRLTQAVAKGIGELNNKIAEQKKVLSVLDKITDPSKAAAILGKEISNIETVLKDKELSPEEKTLYEGMKKELEKQLTIFNKLENDIFNLNGISSKLLDNQKWSTEKLEKMLDSEDVLPEVKTHIKKLLKIANSDLDKTAKEKAIQEEQKKIQELTGTYLEKMKKDATDSLTNSQNELIELKDMNDKLITLNKAMKLVSEYNLAQISGNEEEKAKMGKRIMAAIEPVRSQAREEGKDIAKATQEALEDYMVKTGIGPGTVEKFLKAAGASGLGKEVQPYLAAVAKVPITKKQSLKMPEIVTSPGAVVLHPREMILPKSYSEFKTIPAMPGPAGTPAMTGGKKEININVTATEKDLGQKIANEIRKVMYNEQLTGMG